MFWWSASGESGGGRKKWFVCAVAMLLGISEPLAALAGPQVLQAGVDPYPSQRDRTVQGKIEHQHVSVHMKMLSCSGQVKLTQDKYRETGSVNLQLNEWCC